MKKRILGQPPSPIQKNTLQKGEESYAFTALGNG